MASPVIQFKRGAFANLPGLKAGEPGFTTDRYDLFVGLTSSIATNKFFGSHRYWTRENGSNSAKLNLVDKDGDNYISLSAANTLAGIVTYYLPPTQGSDGTTLINDGDGNLSWHSFNVSPTFSGITTFTDTTDNTLGNPGTGSIQISGGVGIAKNLTVGAGLSVGGQSYFIGTATFYGGQINLGDSDADDINVAGEFISNLIPNTDDTYDIGQGVTPKRWRNANFSGVGTFASGIDANDVNIGLNGTNKIDTSSGVLVLDSAAGQIHVNDDLSVTGFSTFTNTIDANGGATIDNVQIGISGDNEIDTSTGNLTLDSAGGTVTVDDELVVTGDVQINGGDIKASDGNANITLTSNTLTTFAGDIKVGGNDIQDSAGNVVFTFDGSQNAIANANLTVSGNLYVTGSTTQVNTESMTVEDRTIELGIVDGSAPSATTTWDLGILFNYHDGSSAKKAGVTWEQSSSRIVFGSQVSDSGGTGVNNPQLTYTAYAPIEIGALWVNDCAGQSQVINCSGTERLLENITVDGGSF